MLFENEFQFDSAALMKKPLVSVIILNYRTADLVIECLDTLFLELSKEIDISVIIADNDSQDGSFNAIKKEIKNRQWGCWVNIVQLRTNGGFAYGNNRAMEILFSKTPIPDYFWLLNPDTLVQNHACKHLVEFLETHRNAGIAGSQILDLNNNSQVGAFHDFSVFNQLLGGLRTGILDKAFKDKLVSIPPTDSTAQEVDWVTGASMMIRREVLQQVGLLDEKYFMYFEETDFCLRARNAGWSCWHVPESKVIHLVGASNGNNKYSGKKKRLPKYWFDSRHRFFLKNYGPIVLVFADAAFLFGFALWRIRRIIQNKPDTDPKNFLRDFFENSFLFKGFRL